MDEEREVVVLQEILEITVDPGAATSAGTIRKKGVTRSKATKTVRMAARSGSPIHIDGDARLQFRSGRQEVQHEVRGCSRQKTVDFRKCDVDKRQRRRVRTARFVHREHKHWPENSNEQKKCSVCHAAEGTNECGLNEDGGVRRIKHEFGFPEAGVNRNVETFRERCKTITETQARTEVRMARIDGVDDIMYGESERQEKHDEEEEYSNGKTMRMHDIRQPSEQERIEHRMTHLPCRSWCRHCIIARGMRRTVELQLRKKDKFRKFAWTT